MKLKELREYSQEQVDSLESLMEALGKDGIASSEDIQIIAKKVDAMTTVTKLLNNKIVALIFKYI